MEDCQIVNLYWERSENAISETDRKYGRMLFGLSRQLVPAKEDAEECINDTYLAAWNRMPDERPVYLGAFLAKILRRISVDKHRMLHAQKRGGYETLIMELTECIPDSFDPQQALENQRLAELLNRFLSSLDTHKRYIFVRRYFYSDSLAQIADQLTVSEGKIKTVLHRIRKSLRKYLEKEGVEL